MTTSDDAEKTEQRLTMWAKAAIDMSDMQPPSGFVWRMDGCTVVTSTAPEIEHTVHVLPAGELERLHNRVAQLSYEVEQFKGDRDRAEHSLTELSRDYDKYCGAGGVMERQSALIEKVRRWANLQTGGRSWHRLWDRLEAINEAIAEYDRESKRETKGTPA